MSYSDDSECVGRRMGFDHLPLQLQLFVAPSQQHPQMALEAE
jgi:hypothetical protein